MSLTRVFLSFDFDHDLGMAKAMGMQLRSPNNEFEVANWSLKEAAPEKLWRERAEYQIKRSHLVVIVLGRHTHRAPGVLDEVAIARRPDVDRPIVQLYPNNSSQPTPVRNGGRAMAWSHDNLRGVLQRAKARAL